MTTQPASSIIADPLYGDFRISESVLLELLACPSLARLKGVDQAGYFHVRVPHNRYSRHEHSVGVMLLLRRFGASVAEQAAGLIHDLSHSAFSHCIDYVLAAGDEERQSLQDDVFHERVTAGEVPGILARHGLDPAYVLDEANFPLLETELPDLCADRLDYSLRTAWRYGVLPIEDCRRFVDGLTARGGRWLFRDCGLAARYAALFMDLNQSLFAGLASAAMFRSVGDVLKRCLAQGYLTEADLYETDAHVLSLIRTRLDQDPELARLYARMDGRVEAVHDPDDFEAEVRCKSRAVDPSCLTANGPARASELDPDLGARIEAELKPKRYCLRFAD